MQTLKIKRLKKKLEIPEYSSLILITLMRLNSHDFHMFRNQNDRTYFHNLKNDKWYELINVIEG